MPLEDPLKDKKRQVRVGILENVIRYHFVCKTLPLSGIFLTCRLSLMDAQKAGKHAFLSFRRKPESSFLIELQTHWTPVFTGVTTFYETIEDGKQENAFDALEGPHQRAAGRPENGM